MVQKKARRRRLGLLISHLASDYAYQRCLGVEHAAEETDSDIVIFPGTLMQDFLGSNKEVSFNFTHNIIFEYAAKLKLDALLICIAGIADYYDQGEFKTFLDHFAGIPVILMEARIPGYRSIVIDSWTGMAGVLEHLIEEHHCRKILFVSGPDNNYDAQVRRQAYLDIMRQHLLPVTPEMMVNGWFSIRCEKEINRLLDENPDAEAICCANDLMAACACQELKRRGLVPGRDIAVTGFDDADISKTLDPPLTTTRVNSYQMGYQAVYEAIHLLDGQPQQVQIIGSSFVLRASCGCGYREGFGGFLDRYLPLTRQSVCPTARRILLFSLLFPVADLCSTRSWQPLTAFLSELVSDVDAQDPAARKLQSEEQVTRVRKLVELCGIELSAERLQNMLGILFTKLKNQISDPERKNELLEFRAFVRQQLSDWMLRSIRAEERYLQEGSLYTSHLIRDALFHTGCTHEALCEICARLRGMGMKSAFLYTYPKSIPVKCGGAWQCSDHMTLCAYLNRQDITVPEHPEELGTENLMLHLSGILGRRFTMLAFCLITEQEQHGFFLCENDLSHYFNTYVTSMQLSAVLKFFALLDERNFMEARLQEALDTVSRKNEMLQMLSTEDDLTKSLNRRGFLEQMQSAILDGEGKGAALCLLDLDNLKSINDTFGHKEGDYAISQFARIVRGVMKTGDVFGRYGGDEFILLLPDIDPERLAGLAQQLNAAFDRFNEISGKPYYIEASVGILPFLCEKGAGLETLLADVDRKLYADKKKKRRSALKSSCREILLK